ncbi:hypothetical protein ACH4TP_40010 [Streptomyces sp. NPDC021012]|uniref:hypothetical protein n=1 Tax=Streptomyces sp. NPDC021012 TaxID=3365107 RepID=UPI00378E09CF
MAVDLAAAGFTVEEGLELALEGWAASTADVAAGFLAGTPMHPAIEQRGEHVAVVRTTVAEDMTARLGRGPVSALMTTYVFLGAVWTWDALVSGMAELFSTRTPHMVPGADVWHHK